MTATVVPVLPPEARVLVMASRPPTPEADRQLAELMSEPMDWLTVGLLAEHAKLAPVLWNRLRPYASRIPDVSAALLRRQASVSEFRMALTETILEGIVRQLAERSVKVMLLKGAALAVAVYRSFAARPMGDLDILVAPGEAEPAWRLLRESDWKPEFEGGEDFYESHHHLPALLDPKGLSVVLEIHRTMLPRPGPFLLDESELWREAQPVQVGRASAWVPSDRHQLLHLCIHFAWSHELGGGLIRTIRDVATLIDRGSPDWEGFLRIAQSSRAGTCAYWTLELARTLGGAAVPEEVLATLRHRQPVALTRMLERAYISGIVGACPSLWAKRMLWSAGVRPRASGHGKYRPWHIGEAFNAEFRLNRRVPIGERIKKQTSGFSAWLRFARILGSSQRIV